MPIGFLDLASGISGDMFLGALADAGAPLETMQEAVRAVAGDRLSLHEREVRRAGLRGRHVEVVLDGKRIHESGGPAEGHPNGASDGEHSAPGAVHDGHGHRTYARIVKEIEGAALTPEVRADSLRVFRLLGEAESEIHGVALEEVHFHEVGSLDAVADVVGTVAGIRALSLEPLYHGPVALGGGSVDTDHGRLPVPAPATLSLLRGRPCTLEPDVGELTTPTGAALLAALTEPAPPGLAIRPRATGYGAGSRDPSRRPNLARLLVGDEEPVAGNTRVAVVEAALDDCTPEEGGHLLNTLLDEGALDVTLTPLIMKKGRPGFLLRVLAPADAGASFAGRVVHLSSSLGARWRIEDRVELERRIDRVMLPDGEIRVKVAILPDGSERPHPEHDDVSTVARARGVPLSRVREEVERVWNTTR